MLDSSLERFSHYTADSKEYPSNSSNRAAGLLEYGVRGIRMALEEDERVQIMEAVDRAIDAKLDHRQVNSPFAQVQADVKRIKTELFNGDDGKTGLAFELRAFFAVYKNAQSRKRNFWVITAVVATVMGVIFNDPVQRGWRDFDALMKLADKAPAIIKLTDDWELYMAVPPAPEQAPYVISPKDSQPPKKKPSFFGPKGHRTEFGIPLPQSAGDFDSVTRIQQENIR